MNKPFDPKRMCGAATDCSRRRPSASHPNGCSHDDGVHRCHSGKGKGTKHLGSGSCAQHLGTTATGVRAAGREQAQNALANALKTLHLEDALDPAEALLEALRVACWREVGLRRMLVGRTSLFGPDHQGDNRPDVVATMHHEALELRSKIAKMAIDAGVSAAFVRIAERQAEVTVRAVQAAIDSIIATGDRQQAEAAAALVLEATVPSGNGLN